MNEDDPFISFPPGALGDAPVRVPVLWDHPAACALNKPRHLPAFQDSRLGGGPRALLPGIQKRAAAGAAQFLRFGLTSPSLLNLLDREASGILLCAKTPEARADLKNRMGSLAFTFRYHFLAEGAGGESELRCELPLAVHRAKPVALVSHQTGKKTFTLFRRLQQFGPFSLWESESPYDRYHQVRLHAAEAGLRLLGEDTYSRSADKGEEASLYGGLCLHLFSLRFPLDEAEREVEAPHPAALTRLLRRLETV